MKNSDDKITISFETLDDYYDLYVSGLNAVASGTLYLTGDVGLLEFLDPILVNGVDSGEVGMEYDFEVISSYCIKVPQFQPVGAGELDFIFVNDGHLYKLSEMYDYGYHKINIEYNAETGDFVLSLGSEEIATTTINDILTFGIDVTNNGQYLYIIGSASDKLYMYEMSIPYDITTINLLYSVSTNSINQNGIAWNSDGTKFFILNGRGKIEEYHTTNWSIAPGSFSLYSISDYVMGRDSSNLYGLNFNIDGTFLYCGHNGGYARQVKLTNPYDITSFESIGSNSDIRARYGVHLSNSGYYLYALIGADNFYKYKLNIPYDITGGVTEIERCNFNSTFGHISPFASKLLESKSMFLSTHYTTNTLYANSLMRT